MARRKNKRSADQPSLPGLQPAAPEEAAAGASSPEQAPPSGRSAEENAPQQKKLPPCLADPPRQHPPEPVPELKGKSVYVIDVNSLIFQVFHALPEMTSPQGEPVNAVYGFMRDVLYLVRQRKPDYLFCALDLPGPTFRDEMYQEYKAQREETPEDLSPQLDRIFELLQRMGIPCLGAPGFEADDILATVAHLVEKHGGRCVLVTADKDCRQLIADHVVLLNLRKKAILDRQGLLKDWGVEPEQVVDFQALVGDPTDNVPGVPSVGPKTAQKMLQQFGSLDRLYEQLDQVSRPKLRQALEQHRQQALLSRKLVRLRRDVPVVVPWSQGQVSRFRLAAAAPVLEELGFRSIVEEFRQAAGEPAPGKVTPGWDAQYETITSLRRLEEVVAQLEKPQWLALDTETTDTRPLWSELVGISFAAAPGRAWYVPVLAPAEETALPWPEVQKRLAPLLENPRVGKLGHNLKYDLLVLRRHGQEVHGELFDTMVASYLLEAGARSHSMDQLARRFLGHETIKISQLIGTGRNQRRMDQVPLELVGPYACEDADVPLRLKERLEKLLGQQELLRLFHEVEMPLVRVLVDMEYHGIRVAPQRLQELQQRFQQELDRLEEEIYQLASRRFNIASPLQLRQVLFEELKLPVLKRTATGPSTDAEVLEELARQHPLPAKVLEYRQFAKLKSTYVDALFELIHPDTGRIHASFNQGVTATGRLSSSEPNLQNIPIRTEQGRQIRWAFVPENSRWRFVAADYSQVELRVLAHFSGDEALCQAFARDEDIHARVASEVFGVPLAEVTPEMRRVAKTVNFGIIYGQTPFGLARQLQIPEEEAARYIDQYFARYPRVEEFILRVLRECRQRGYVSTLLGRRRAIRGVREQVSRHRNLAERTAVNTVIQGSAADLIKLAMLRVHEELARGKLQARLLLQIHDELVLEAPQEELPQVVPLVRECMAGVWQLRVPLKVDVSVGENWAQMEEVPGGL